VWYYGVKSVRVFGCVLWRPLDTFFWALTISWSRDGALEDVMSPESPVFDSRGGKASAQSRSSKQCSLTSFQESDPISFNESSYISTDCPVEITTMAIPAACTAFFSYYSSTVATQSWWLAPMVRPFTAPYNLINAEPPACSCGAFFIAMYNIHTNLTRWS
jgi:hypothetical protein